MEVDLTTGVEASDQVKSCLVPVRLPGTGNVETGYEKGVGNNRIGQGWGL